MSQNACEGAVIPRQIAIEAVDLWVLLQEADEPDSRRQLLQQIEKWQSQSPVHNKAWQRLSSFKTDLDMLQSHNYQGINKKVLDRRKGIERRQLLFAGLTCGVLSAGWFWAHRQSFDGDPYRTQVGEVSSLTLQDGSLVQLNTATELFVSVMENGQMLLRLTKGEILVETSQQITPASRQAGAMLVQTELMRVQPLGTRFLLRVEDAYVKASLYEGELQLDSPLMMRSSRLLPGESLTLSISGEVSRGQSNNHEYAWQRRMLIVQNMPLQNFLNELSRYHRLWVRCEPSITQRLVSGTYPVDDLVSVFKVLGGQLGVEFNFYLGVWVIVKNKLT